MVPIDRSAGGAAIREMLRRAKDETARGRSIMIMPEGTRLPPGRTGRYHPGVAALYTVLGLTVVPVALNSGLFWGRRSLIIRPGTVTMEFLAPIAPGLERKEFMTALQERIETASERLRHEALKDGASGQSAA
jgi:1-acyl-sn-glycerol-3-phosphate acyltransferase